ncbi:nadh dehydrogenase [Fusarium sporotrichioides]|uniref:Nadh dehydrogenase n=1 Tax=Fusarium sporotrichioides TaxID=5514 RepID=A0A395S8X1_FUSSP|nr:nadh dehydrogenase [Fusarium sporotrichioides]
MRYKDWDVLLFGQDHTTPLQEFRVACYVVHDTESSNPQAPGVPIVTCFVPSLVPGTPFNISIHLWKKPRDDQVVDNEYPAINSKLFIDGALVSSTFANLGIYWPCIVSFTDRKEVLRFPIFQQELLYQRHWNAADNLGRIKLVISEGIRRSSPDDMTFQRVHNRVVFSFQHAPQDVLEHLEIAWPNPSMWRRLQQSSTLSQISSNSDAKDQTTVSQSPSSLQSQVGSEFGVISPGTPSFYLDDQSNYPNDTLDTTMSSSIHIVPPHNQDVTPHMSTPELRLPENFRPMTASPKSPMFDHPELASFFQTPEIFQQTYIPANGSVPNPLVRLQTQSPAIHGSTKFGQGTAEDDYARFFFRTPAHKAQQPFNSNMTNGPAKRARAESPSFESPLKEDYGH